jgi:predicted  nucleic acid-binding Zn-ribbon protein
MSEVKRVVVLWPVGPVGFGNQEAVLAADFDAAQSELAALREELDRRDSAAMAYDLKRDMQDDLQQRLTAAEQRNRTLEILLRRASNYGGLTPEWHDAVQAALKPTESGASE